MQVLGNQNSPHPSHLHIQHHSTPKKSLPSLKSPTQNTNHFLSSKKKLMNANIKPNMPCDFRYENFKENHPKPNNSQSNEPLKNRTAERHYKMAPFSSVLNTKPQPKISQPPKPTSKTPEQQQVNQQKKDDQHISPKDQTKKYIEKMMENKLNHMIQNKRKSASFKAAIGPKQLEIHSQKRKQSYHVEQTKKPSNYQQKQKSQQQDKKQILVNKQKGSLSFIFRKKINSNATQSQRNYEKIGKNEGMKSFEKEEFIKSQNSKYIYEANSYNINTTSQNSTLTKYAYKPMEDQLKKLRQRHPENKQNSGKAHLIKGMKCLKVRVNKILKAQEQLFNQKYFPKENINRKNGTQKVQQPSKKEQVHPQINNAKKPQSPAQIVERLITIEQILQNQTKKTTIQPQQNSHHRQDSNSQSNLIDTQQSKKNDSAKPIVQVKKSQNEVKGQAKSKSYKETSKEPNPINRKRISSIRAIKNYYKKLDTQHYAQEKSSFMTSEKESKQGTIKKKDKESAACLTHKIKWGNSSKKKLNSDRIPCDAFNFAPQFSIDGNKNQIKQEKITDKNEMAEKQQFTLKATIETKKFISPKANRPFNKVQFLEEQFLKVKEMRTPKAEKNLQKIFSQTINSKDFIDCEPIPFHSGSKSLIMFEDPGISMIINNNNSIHSPTYPIGLNYQPSQELGNVQIYQVSPVAMVKKRAYDMIEEKCENEHNPLESLQELYFELKSRKDINPKPKDREIRIQSLEELCQG